MENNLKVDVLMPVYNCEKYIEQAIQSVLEQTYQNFHLYIINDGSTDSSQEIAERYAAKDKRITIISHPNMGMGNSLNKALKIATAEWIVRMDADDEMMPNRIERQVEFAKSHPNLAVASSFVLYINEYGEMIGKSYSELTNLKTVNRIIESNDLIGFSHPAVIMKREVVLAVGGYRGQYWPADDIDLWNRIVEKGYQVLVQPEYLLKYRIHSNSISISGARSARLKVHWVKESMLARRKGKIEPTWEEFCEIRDSIPIYKKINQERKDLAKILYKKATFAYSSKEYRTFLTSFLCSSFLQPTYTLRQAYIKAWKNL